MHINVLKKNLINNLEVNKIFSNQINKNKDFDAIVNIIIKSLKNGGKLYIAGNGGSAADAQHLAAEFVCKLNFDRDPLPAEALTVDTSIITAIGNDYDFSKVFSRQVKSNEK